MDFRWGRMLADTGRRAPGGGEALLAQTFAYQVRFLRWLWRRGIVGAGRRGVGGGPVIVSFDVVADFVFGFPLPHCFLCQFVGPTYFRASQK